MSDLNTILAAYAPPPSEDMIAHLLSMYGDTAKRKPIPQNEAYIDLAARDRGSPFYWQALLRESMKAPFALAPSLSATWSPFFIPSRAVSNQPMFFDGSVPQHWLPVAGAWKGQTQALTPYDASGAPAR